MNLTKLPKKKKVTVNDLLATDSVNELLESITKQKNSFDDVVVIAVKKNDKSIIWDMTEMDLSKLIYLLETVKVAMLTEGGCE
jgi:hypothetical protein